MWVSTTSGHDSQPWLGKSANVRDVPPTRSSDCHLGLCILSGFLVSSATQPGWDPLVWRCGYGTGSGTRAPRLSPGARSPPCFSLWSCLSPPRTPPPTPGPIIHSFHWTRNSRFFNIAKDPRVSMKRRSGTLVIDFRSGGRPEEYEGEYQCFARNKFGTALSNRIRLQVSSE